MSRQPKAAVQLRRPSSQPLALAERAEPAPLTDPADDNIEDLFPPRATTAALPAMPAQRLILARCEVCEGRKKREGTAGSGVCEHCTRNPDEARREIEQRRGTVLAQQQQAAHAAQSAWDGLSEAERERWGRYEAVRTALARGEPLDGVARKKYNVTTAAYNDDNDSGVTPAMRAYYRAAEQLRRANAACDAGQRTCNVRLAVLALALEAT